MRLTLRTLLAYLDDTLEPELAREIGQKVGESTVAQELIDRIKHVTRRRGLANPPSSGPTKIDPNTLAEYLDNGLSAEQTTEVEETCLADDTYLAEVASCHQILTLMLSEPAIVPPPARRRMYRLVKGRESIPYRRPPVSPSLEPGHPADADKFGPDALPLPPAGTRLLWPLAAAVLLIAALVVAIYKAIPAASGPAPAAPLQVASTERPIAADHVIAPPTTPVAVAPTTHPVTRPAAPVTTRPKPPAPAPPPTTTAGAGAKPPATGKPAGTKPPTAPVAVRIPKPSPDVKPLGRLEPPTGGDAVVVLLRRVDRQPWLRVRTNDTISGGDRLLSLPAFTSEVRLDSGIGLRLHGGLPGHNGSVPSFPLYETEAVLHAPPTGFDADLTVDIGEVHLINRKPQGEARVLVRFGDQSWQVTLLDNNTEVIMDVLSQYQDPERFNAAGGGEPPRLGVALGAARGRARLQTDPYAASLLLQAAPPGQAPPAPVLVQWDSKVGRLAPVNATPSFWGRQPQTPDQRRADVDLDQAKRGLHQRLSRPESAVEVALAEMVAGQSEASRKLAVYCLEAIKALPALLDALQDEQNKDVREAAVQALIHYVGEAPDNNHRVFEVLTQSKDYSPGAAALLVQLLQGVSAADQADPNAIRNIVAALNDPHLGLRELAAYRLEEIAPGGMARAHYSTTADPDQRSRAATEWGRQLESKVSPRGRPNGRP